MHSSRMRTVHCSDHLLGVGIGVSGQGVSVWGCLSEGVWPGDGGVCLLCPGGGGGVWQNF